MLSRYFLDPERKLLPQEKFEFIHLSDFFRDVILSYKYRCEPAKLYNYCEQLCEDFAFHLIRFKVFFNGKIGLHLIRYYWPSSRDGHEILLLNSQVLYKYKGGSYECRYEFTEDSILCNPLHKEIFVGKEAIESYLKDKIFSSPQDRIINYMSTNICPNFEKFTFNKDTHVKLINLLKDAYLEEAYNSQKSYIGAIRFKVENFFLQQYITFKKEQNNSYTIDSLCKIYDFSDKMTNEVKKIIEKLNIKVKTIQAAYRGFLAFEQRKSLEKQREQEIKDKSPEYVRQLMVEEKYDQVIELVNAIKDKKLHKAIQIIRKIPEKEMQLIDERKVKY